MKQTIQYLFLLACYITLTSQGCQQVTPTSCSGIEVFYGPLVESYGPASDGNTKHQDRFYVSDIYYKSSNQEFKSIEIEFQTSEFETLSGGPLLGQMPKPKPLTLQSPTSFPVNADGNATRLATIVWRVKYTDFGNTALGKQKFTFIDTNGNAFSDCEPSFVMPPSLNRKGAEEYPEPAMKYPK